MVDMDLEKFFDRVNHDILMARLARRVGDKRLLRIMRRFLEAGMMQNGVCVERHEGTPQGGPLSPLVGQLAAGRSGQGTGATRATGSAAMPTIATSTCGPGGGRTGAGVGDRGSWKEVLRLRVNRDESAVASRRGTQVPGPPSPGGRQAGRSPPAVWNGPRTASGEITRRNRGVSFEQMIGELNSFLTGWVTLLPPRERARAT